MDELAQAALLATGGPLFDRAAAAAFNRGFDASAFLQTVEAAGCRVLARSSPDYPPLLAAIHDPPAVLFARGEAGDDVLSRTAVAIVGARSCSPYGAGVARTLARELAAAGVVVVSGLARGVDSEAHRGAVEGGGATVAVLGCGIDRIYPAGNAALADRILTSGGLILSEYPPGVRPAPWRFPARNRIVAGIAAATVVVEARARSGALITADFALESGRDVLAVPGEITSALSQGTNALIRTGATPVTSVADVVELLGIELAPREAPPLDDDAQRVVDALAAGPSSVDELARATTLAADVLAALLTRLELAGRVVSGDGTYRVVMPARS